MDVLIYIIWVLAFMVIVAIGIGVPYMTYYNYKRIKAMDKKLTGMCTGLGIMLRPEEGDEKWEDWFGISDLVFVSMIGNRYLIQIYIGVRNQLSLISVKRFIAVKNVAARKDIRLRVKSEFDVKWGD